MPDLTSTEIYTTQIRIASLKQQLKTEKKNHFMKMYTLLSSLLKEERKLKPAYTIRQLASENDMNEITVGTYLAWRHATPQTKKLVAEKKIAIYKAVKVIRGPAKNNQKEVIDEIIKNNYSDREVTCHLKNGKFGKRVFKEREYTMKNNLARDLLRVCSRAQAILPSVIKIVDSQKKEVINELTKVNTLIEKAIVILKK